MQSQRCDVYGSEEGYTKRAMVLYDGIHYDALALAGRCVFLLHMERLPQVASSQCWNILCRICGQADASAP